MQIGGVGAFPNFRRARVVWIGVNHEARLELLHHDLEVAAETEGFEIAGRAFRPHVTLARVRTPLELEHVRRLARLARTIDFTATTDVSEITLFESTLASAGARYRRLHGATLGGGRGGR
jgi:2'-5' RNA ligase